MTKILRNFRAKCTNGGGFTLAELLIVVAVIAVLVAVAIPTFGDQLEKSRQAVDQSNLRDAYAAAQIAILNVDDEGNVLQGVVSSGYTADKYFRFWYTSSGQLKQVSFAAQGTAASSAVATMGKATTSKVVKKTELPVSTTYTDNTLKVYSSGVGAQNDKAGSTAKGIVVEVLYSSGANTFKLSNVTFANLAVDSGGKPMKTGIGSNGS